MVRFRFYLKDLFLFTLWVSLCLSLSTRLELNTAGIVIALVGLGLSLAGLLFGELGRGIAAASALYLLCAAVASLDLAVGDGRSNVATRVVVSDLNTKHPIRGASITLHDLSAEVETAGGKSLPLGSYTTDADGGATIVLELPFAAYTTVFTHSARVYCSEWLRLKVECSGYNSVDCSLADRIGRSFRPTRKPPAVHIEMRPSGVRQSGGRGHVQLLLEPPDEPLRFSSGTLHRSIQPTAMNNEQATSWVPCPRFVGMCVGVGNPGMAKQVWPWHP
jgi:hypothetical protein